MAFTPTRPLTALATSNSLCRSRNLYVAVRRSRRYSSTLQRRANHALSPSTGLDQHLELPNELYNATTFSRPPRAEVTPRSRYHELVARGSLRDDTHQGFIIDKLQFLHDQLKTYDPPLISPPSPPSLLDRLFHRELTSEVSLPGSAVPKGLYLFGDVGTGKSMLMDLFYDTLPSNIRRKRRAHFHAFMIDVHKRVHTVKASAGRAGLLDPILPVARDLANEASVLCFDEFQVTDIVDAMILRRLFECLLRFGVVSVMTSNRHPDDLYKNGIQRSSFIPCIDLIKTRFDVTDLDSGTDYRRIPRALSHVFYHPLTLENVNEVTKIFNAMTADSPVVKGQQLKIWGRTLTVPESSGKIAKFMFQDLCGKPLSAVDYIELTRAFKTIFLLDVPKMDLNQKDMARRFITFIDACYESKTKLFTTSEVPIHQVFSDSDSSSSKIMSDHQRSVMDDLGLSEEAVGMSSMFSGEEEIFAFARACSRLVQMGTKEWAEMAGHE